MEDSDKKRAVCLCGLLLINNPITSCALQIGRAGFNY